MKMIYKFSEYLKESPNIVITDNTRLDYHDDDAIPFGMFNNKIFVGGYSKMHFYMYPLQHQKKLTKNEGRLWVNSKIISFYTPYPEPEFLLDYLKKLEKLINTKFSIKLNFFTSKWKIDFTDIKKEFVKKRINIEHIQDLIDFNTYRYYWKDIKNLNIERQDHLVMNPNAKKVVPYGYGSKNPEYLDKRAWQLASLTDENYKINIKKFNNF